MTMDAFLANPKNSGKVCRAGLWGVSRHPNYLGEMLFWIAVACFGLAAAGSDANWTLVGPAGIIILFFSASIPMMEERQSKRRKGWAAYAADTPLILPLGPSVVRLLPFMH